MRQFCVLQLAKVAMIVVYLVDADRCCPTQKCGDFMKACLVLLLLLVGVVQAFVPPSRPSISRTTELCTARKQKIAYYKKWPVTLYRMEETDRTNLRAYEAQMAKKRKSYDVKLDENGLVQPASCDNWVGPNGMSLRPATDSMLRIAQAFRGEQRVHRFDEGMTLPDGLIVVLWERDDHYAMQTTEPCTLEELNYKISALIQPMDFQTKEEFIEQLLDGEDQDN